MTKQPRKHGGHNAGSISPRNDGSGPVYDLRMRLGLTRPQLADKTGISVRTIEKWEQTGGAPVRGLYVAALKAVEHG